MQFASLVLGLLAASAAHAAITMNVDLADGATVSGDRVFSVSVTSDTLVTNVEFYVNGDLRGTDESTPYQFRLDSLDEKDGTATLMFAAYNSNGESAKRTIQVKVDNGLSLGVEHHVAKANDAITIRKFDEAIRYARVALKIDGKSNVARMAMARANYGKRVYDVAQKFAEDVVADDPANLDAKAILSAISLRKAFSATGGSVSETNALIRSALVSAAKNAHDALEARADAFGPVTATNQTAFIDLMLKSHRYSRVTTLLKDKVEAEAKNTALMNRLLYAYVRSGRIVEAAKTLRYIEQYGALDGYTYALKAVLMQFAGEQTASEDAEKESILEDPSGAATKYTQAYLALARGRLDVLSSHVGALQRMEPTAPLTAFYLCTRYHLFNDFDESQKYFEQCLLADPGNYDMLVEKGNQVVQGVLAMKLSGDDKKNRLDLATAYFEAALEAKPDSFEALTGMSLVYSMNGKVADGLRFGRAAVAASKEYSPAYFALASAIRLARTTDIGPALRAEADEVKKSYESMDRRLRGQLTPSAEQAWQYFYLSGRVPAIPTPASIESN